MEEKRAVRRITIDLPWALYEELKKRSKETRTTMRGYSIRALRASFDEPRSPDESYVATPADERFIEFDQQTASASEIWVAGLTLRGLRENYQAYLSQRIREGVSLRLLLLHPDLGIDSPILRAVEAWVSGGEQPVREVTDLVEDIRESTRFFHGLKSLAKNRSRIQVRGHDQTMGFGVTLADPHGPAGDARVSLYLFGGAASGPRHPALYFKSSASSMFGALLEHFRSLWRASKPVT